MLVIYKENGTQDLSQASAQLSDFKHCRSDSDKQRSTETFVILEFTSFDDGWGGMMIGRYWAILYNFFNTP